MKMILRSCSLQPWPGFCNEIKYTKHISKKHHNKSLLKYYAIVTIVPVTCKFFTMGENSKVSQTSSYVFVSQLEHAEPHLQQLPASQNC